MSRGRQITLGSIAAGAMLSVVATARSERAAFEDRIAREVDGLFGAARPPSDRIVDEADLAALPEPVQRWLRWSGVVGNAYPSFVRLRQEGELRLGGGGWVPFDAEEYYSTDPPGFVWSASITMVPLVTVVGRDRYADGKGSIEMRMFGVLPIARDSGPEMDRGALLRYLNEIMWFPAGAISPYIAWEPIDGTSARARMTYGGVSAPAIFVFDRDGRLTNMVAERYDRDAGRVLPWSTPISDYGAFDGIRVPVMGEAVYARGSGDFSYIRLRVTDVEYNRPERFGRG